MDLRDGHALWLLQRYLGSYCQSWKISVHRAALRLVLVVCCASIKLVGLVPPQEPCSYASCSSLSRRSKQQTDTTEDKEGMWRNICARVNKCCSRRDEKFLSHWCFFTFLAHQCWCWGLWPGPGISWFLPRGVPQRSLHWMPWPGHLQLLCKCLQLLACHYRKEWDVQVSSWFIYQYLRLSQTLSLNNRSIVWV